MQNVLSHHIGELVFPAGAAGQCWLTNIVKGSRRVAWAFIFFWTVAKHQVLAVRPRLCLLLYPDRVTESQSCRLDEVRRDLWRSPGPTLLLKQGHLKLVDQNHIWVAFEYLWAWETPQPSWATFSSAGSPSHEKSVSWCWEAARLFHLKYTVINPVPCVTLAWVTVMAASQLACHEGHGQKWALEGLEKRGGNRRSCEAGIRNICLQD